MTKLKRYCLFLSRWLFFHSLLSHLLLSPHHLSISCPSVFFFFLIDTPISRRFHARGIPNGSPLMTNRSIFIDLKVAGLENCLTIFETAARFCGTALFSLSFSPGPPSESWASCTVVLSVSQTIYKVANTRRRPDIFCTASSHSSEFAKVSYKICRRGQSAAFWGSLKHC